MSRKDKIIELLSEYINVRKAIYGALQARDGKAKELLNNEKHALLKKAFNLLTVREYETVKDSFAGITTNKIPNCFEKDMRGYILDSSTDQYMQCLELQKATMLKVIEDKVILRETIVDVEGGILLCPAGEYYDGKCNVEVDTIKIPSEHY